MRVSVSRVSMPGTEVHYWWERVLDGLEPPELYFGPECRTSRPRPEDIYYSLHLDEGTAFSLGRRYRYSPVSALFFEGRSHDFALQKARQTINERLHLRLWLTPLRFEGGRLTSVRRTGRWTIERLYDEAGREMLYLLSFYLPRFLEHPLREKLATVVHELWHIGPGFDGDLRRHPGRCYAHSHSQRHQAGP